MILALLIFVLVFDLVFLTGCFKVSARENRRHK